MASVVAWLQSREPPPPLILVEGEERRLAQRVVVRLREAVEGELELAFLHLDAAEASPSEVVAHAETLPMLSPRMTVVVEGIERWLARGGGAEEEGPPPSLDPLLDYLEAPNPTTTLCLLAAKLDGRSRATRRLRDRCLHLEAKATPADAARWCAWVARRAGVRLERGAGELLVDHLGLDLARLETEVERLALLVEAGGTVTRELAEQQVAPALPGVWDFVGSLAARDRRRALTTLHGLLASGEVPFRLLGLVAWQVRQLLRARAALDRGRPRDEVARELRLYGHRADRLFRQAARFTEAELRAAHARLTRADLEMKGRGLGPELALEQVVLDLCPAAR
ncbi:MAG: DNA polymerase III subunit delta [Nitrospirae bacterium]|nr:MAG: DNA polymerase III subunit delta [Nitrospirota bacterium]